MNARLLLIASCLALSPLSGLSQGITVNFSAGLGERTVALEPGVPVPDGNYVNIGYFDAGYDPAAHADDAESLFAAFNIFGSTTVQTIWGEAGHFGGTASSTDAQFSAKPIWVWVFKTADNAQPTTDLSNLEGYGLFTANSWQFPTTGSLPPGNTANINSMGVDRALFGSFDAQSLYLSPALVVPEPSTWALCALALVTLITLSKRSRE
jgi:hypothetical protein